MTINLHKRSSSVSQFRFIDAGWISHKSYTPWTMKRLASIPASATKGLSSSSTSTCFTERIPLIRNSCIVDSCVLEIWTDSLGLASARALRILSCSSWFGQSSVANHALILFKSTLPFWVSVLVPTPLVCMSCVAGLQNDIGWLTSTALP